MNVLIVGPAGSGKSTFVRAFLDHLRDYDVKAVNLDPASDPIYPSHADVRRFVRTEDVMREYGLGINGALIKSMEIALNHVDSLIVRGDYVLYDTPGQMELFLYLKAGIEMANRIAESDWTVCVFVVDSEVASTPENYVSILAQNAVISLRTGVPTITVFNKSDVVDVDLTPSKVKETLSKEEGVLAELMERLVDFLEFTTARFRTIKISALKGEGLDDVLSAINEVFCSCGDLS